MMRPEIPQIDGLSPDQLIRASDKAELPFLFL